MSNMACRRLARMPGHRVFRVSLQPSFVRAVGVDRWRPPQRGGRRSARTGASNRGPIRHGSRCVAGCGIQSASTRGRPRISEISPGSTSPASTDVNEPTFILAPRSRDSPWDTRGVAKGQQQGHQPPAVGPACPIGRSDLQNAIRHSPRLRQQERAEQLGRFSTASYHLPISLSFLTSRTIFPNALSRDLRSARLAELKASSAKSLRHLPRREASRAPASMAAKTW